jgi:hypothetical protein
MDIALSVGLQHAFKVYDVQKLSHTVLSKVAVVAFFKQIFQERQRDFFL